MAIVNEVVTKFSFDGNIAPLTHYNDNLVKGIKSLAIITTAITGAKVALVAMTHEVLKNSEAQDLMSQRTGESFQAIQELGFIANVTGSSAHALESTIENLSVKIGDASLFGNESFAQLGVSIRGSNGELKKASEVLEDVRKKFNRLNISQKRKLAHLGMLGIDPSLVGMLSTSNTEMDKLKSKAQALGVVTDAQGDKIIKYSDALTVLNFGMKSLGIQTSVSLAPKMTALSEKFTEFLIANKKLISEGIEKTLDILEAVIEAIGRFIESVNIAVKSTLGWTKLSVLLAIMFSPLYAVPALVLAIIAIFDDLYVFIQGGDSFLSGFFQPLITSSLDAIDKIKKMFSGMLDWIGNTFKSIIPESLLDFFSTRSNGMRLVDSTGKMKASTSNNSSVSNRADNNSITQDVTINISADNPEEAGAAVRNAMQTEFRNAQDMVGRGGGR